MSGTMRERPTGSKRWELRAYAGRDRASGKGRQVSRVFHGGKREANRALDALVSEVQEGKHVGTSANFKTLSVEYLAHIKRTKERETFESYRIKLESNIVPALGTIKLSALGAHDLDALYAQLADEGYASTTIEHVHNVISGSLTQAVRWGWIERNIATLATPPKAEAKKREPLPISDIARLVQAAIEDDRDMATLIYLLCCVGGRRGEACGFQWGDVDWQRQAIKVERQIVPTAGGQRVKLPKGNKRRFESIGPEGVRILMAYQATLRERLGESWKPTPSGWLISPDGGSTPVRAKGVTPYIKALGEKLTDENGEPAPIDARPHDFRRLSVTQLLHEGVDPKTVQDRHGHASMATMELYALTVPASDREAAEVMGRLLMPVAALLAPETTKSAG